MTKDETDQLLTLLDKFFQENDLNARDFLCKNKIAALLKRNLMRQGRWKNLSRGKPRGNLS